MLVRDRASEVKTTNNHQIREEGKTKTKRRQVEKTLRRDATKQQDGGAALPRQRYPDSRGSVELALGYKDVEESIRAFDGNDNYSIERWIADFEEGAIKFEWNDIQTLVFARRSLTGIAKLFVRSERVHGKS